MGFQKVEFEFPDEKEKELEIESSGALEVDIGGTGKNSRGEDIKKPVEKEEDDIELEVVDDTPKADRNRKPSDPPEEVTEEELENYSEKVRNRIKHFTKGYHDERRAKETALRERQELEALAQKLVAENKVLKTEGTKSQTALLKQAKTNADNAYNSAKYAYKTAYNNGDPDKVLAAQERLTDTKATLDKVNAYEIPTLQAEESSVQDTQETAIVQPVPRDTRAEQWAKENTWFNTDSEMTAYALGLHSKLVKEGLDPKSDDYYDRINGRMRDLFPDNFEDADDRPSQRKQSNVVAPASRSSIPKKIRLTQTQVRLAKRLGLTPEQYARQVAIDMRKDR